MDKRLSFREKLLTSFMLFSLFFGAGNLIFPPFLGQSAGTLTVPALLGFLVTAVLLPILGVIVVAKFGGLDCLSSKVGPGFKIIFTMVIYLAIGPGLGIPRAASVPFEMAVAPYLPESFNLTFGMLLYSLVFFAVALWLALTPSKLVTRIGTYLTPTLLFLIVFLFVSFLIMGNKVVAEPIGDYASTSFLKGFCEGYNTMDAIAALNFGLVIATTINGFGVKEEKSVIKTISVLGTVAGSVLAFVYVMLTAMGSLSSGVYEVGANGAVLLREIVKQLYGPAGAVVIAAIFTLACLTTCVGLITSISQFFAKMTPGFSYKKWVLVISIGAFLICNLGLDMILMVSVPVLNSIYPASIVLIVMGLFERYYRNNRFIFPITILGTLAVSVVIEAVKLFDNDLLSFLPLHNTGFSWVLVTVICFAVSVVLHLITAKKKST